MAFKFITPHYASIGEGALEASEAAVRALGKKALIVTGRHVTRAGAVKKLTDCLEKWGIRYEVYNDITGEPTVDMVVGGVRAYKAAGCDFLIGIGGGSPLDSAKAIGAMTVLSGGLPDYMGREIEGNFPPVAAIPTTAGTGSEATKFTVITDPEKDIKMLLLGDVLVPQAAIVDPAFTMTAPPEVTASTGMDALTHAVESYTSRRGNALTDMYALDAIRRIFAFLPAAYEDGGNAQARAEMAIAAYEAGVAINNASTTIVHGMSRPIGALFHVPHGISNAMLIGECMAFALDGCYGRFARIAREIGAADSKQSDPEAAEAFLGALTALCKRLRIPTLQEYGVDKHRFDSLIDKMAHDGLASRTPLNTIKEVKEEDMVAIYHRLW
jgi:Alcohol dehydrogenase, class IV